jgi:hypothetical protein
MPLKTYFQTFVLQTSEGQRSNVEDKEDQSSNEDQILIVDDDDQNSNLYNKDLKRLSKDPSSIKNKDDQSVKSKGQSKRKRQNANPNIEDQRSKRLSEDQYIPMEECSENIDDLEIIDFVSSNTSGTNEQLSTSLNWSSVKSPVAKSPITQLSSGNDSKHEKLATLKTYNKNRKSNKLTFPKATDQNYTSNQMSEPNCLTVKQEIKKEREEEDTLNSNTKTQNNEMSLTNCQNTEEDITIEDPLSFSLDSNRTSQNDSLTNCPNDEEITFEESPLFSSSIKVEESQIMEFPSFSDESQNDTLMETSGKFIDK